MRRREFIALVGGAAVAWPVAARAQQPRKWRIGFLGTATASGSASWVGALREGLRDLGYVEGKNLVIEFRWAEDKYERLPGLAAELVRLKVDVIVTHATPGGRAAKAATTTIPIVMAIVADPVATGIVASLARPGGNVTGMTGINDEVAAKRLELLKGTFPRTRQVAVLLNPDNPSDIGPVFRAMEAAAKSLDLELHQFGVRVPGDFESAFAAIAKRRVDAVVSSQDTVLTDNAREIASLAAKMQLPSVGPYQFADAGGLMAYGANRLEFFRRAAYFVDRILKGAKPADLPSSRQRGSRWC